MKKIKSFKLFEEAPMNMGEVFDKKSHMNVVITLTDESLSRFEEVKQELTNEGLSIQETFEFGVIFGIADEEAIQRLKKHPDVISVELEKIAKAFTGTMPYKKYKK